MPYGTDGQEDSTPTAASRVGPLSLDLNQKPKKKKPFKRGLAAAAQERGGIGSPLGPPALTLPGPAPPPSNVEQVPPTKRLR